MREPKAIEIGSETKYWEFAWSLKATTAHDGWRGGVGLGPVSRLPVKNERLYQLRASCRASLLALFCASSFLLPLRVSCLLSDASRPSSPRI